MNKKRILGSILCGLISALSVTSCGGTNNSNGNSNINSNSNSSVTSKLVIGLECNYAPFNWTENNANEYTLPISNMGNSYADGYDIQIAKYLGEKLNYDIVIKKLEWDALLTSMVTGDINCIIAGMSYSEERDLTIDFTNNYYTSEMTIVVRKNSPLANITNVNELANYKVVSQRGTLTYDIIDQIPNVIKQPALDSFAVASLSVASGTSDAMTAEYPVAKAIVNGNSSLTLVTFSKENGFKNLDENELGVAIGIQEGNNELKELINNALNELSDEKRKEMMDGAIDRAPGSDN